MRYYELLERDTTSLHQALSAQYPSAVAQSAVASYQSGSSRAINDRLLGKGKFWRKGRDTRTIHGLLDLIHHSAPLQQPLRVYSNTGAWNPLPEITHQQLVTKPFTSTSLDYDLVFSFGAARPNSAHVILQFDLPAGYHNGVYVGHAETAVASQREYILAPNQRWAVENVSAVENNGTNWTIVALRPA